MTKPLSPVAHAVLDAAIDADGEESMHFPYEAIAAADQIIEDVNPVEKLIHIAQEIEETK